MSERKQQLIYCEYQDYIDGAPVQPQHLHAQACSNDGATINSWRDIWTSQARANHAVHGPFKDKSLGRLYNKHRHMPIFVLGAGPSLKKNAHKLVGNHGIPIISCLHNFHFLEDLGVKVDYYVTLDCGDVTIEEVSEGGNPSTDYWEKTKGKKLLCYIGTHPNLLAKWQGEIYFFNCPIPDPAIEAEIDAIERFKILVASGGNVLGASLYIAKAILGAATTILLGADFSFSYEEKFHPFDSKYDKDLGLCVRVTDVYGNKVKTWASYANFKAWFDWVSLVVPGDYINCTEGGIFGAYPQGNIKSIKQLDVADVLSRYGMSTHMQEQAEKPDTAEIKILFC